MKYPIDLDFDIHSYLPIDRARYRDDVWGLNKTDLVVPALLFQFNSSAACQELLARDQGKRKTKQGPAKILQETKLPVIVINNVIHLPLHGDTTSLKLFVSAIVRRV